MAQEHGIWVHQGQARSGFHWHTIVDTIGDEQIKVASSPIWPAESALHPVSSDRF